MNCPKCGTENSADVQVCRSCGTRLLPPPVPSAGIVPKASGLAIAAFVLGILSFFTCGLTALPAIVLGIVGLILIEKSGGRLTGKGFAIVGIVIPVLVLCLLIVLLLPASFKAKQTASRMACGTNLSGIGRAMVIYANDYDGKFPCSGGKNSRWAMVIPAWQANNRFVAYGLAPDGSAGQGSITSCFYLLVKYAEVMPKSFICRGDSGASEFNLTKEGFADGRLIDLWDFGPEPRKHCSYSYHQPFSLYPLTASSEPGTAVAADRNPWIESPARAAKTYPGLYNPDGGRKAIKAGNAIQHQEDGQNVLFLDGHVGFEKQPFCGVKDDNIYTFWDGGDIRKGGTPILGASQPMDRLDSFLVHDGRGAAPGMSPKLPVE